MNSVLDLAIILFFIIVIGFVCIVSVATITANTKRGVIATDCRYSCKYNHDSEKYDLKDEDDTLYCLCYKEVSKTEIK